MARFSSNFVCQQCGYVSPSYLGKCPNCDSWNSFSEEVTSTGGGKRPAVKANSIKPVKLSEVPAGSVARVSTGMSELDRVLGGGIVPGMAVLVAGEPGIGKSTLLLELARNFEKSAKGKGVLYVAGEESASQIKIRAGRLKVGSDNLLILEQTDADQVAAVIEQTKAVTGIIVVDSVQTMVTSDLVGTAGSVGQVRECASRLVSVCKQAGLPLFLVGHVTKEGAIAGPKVLEHIVDTIINVEGERFTGLRLVRTSKNRFGATDEVGMFEMGDGGLTEVKEYEGLFLDAKEVKPGSCLTVVMEGTRPVLVEVQALVTETPLPMPRRVASGVNYNRLQTTVAILQKRLNIPLFKDDIYVSVAGGMKIEEPAADLAVALAIVSSFRNRSLPAGTVAIGELDLLGNVRSVNGLTKRIKEAKRLGFKNIASAETLKTASDFKF